MQNWERIFEGLFFESLSKNSRFALQRGLAVVNSYKSLLVLSRPYSTSFSPAERPFNFCIREMTLHLINLIRSINFVLPGTRELCYYCVEHRNASVRLSVAITGKQVLVQLFVITHTKKEHIK